MIRNATLAAVGVFTVVATTGCATKGYVNRRIDGVNAVAPGPIPTEGVRKAFAPPPGSGPPDLFAPERAMEAYARGAIPLQRWGAPRDIANMVAFLASPAGDWITGAILVVDGGEWLAKGGRQGAPGGS